MDKVRNELKEIWETTRKELGDESFLDWLFLVTSQEQLKKILGNIRIQTNLKGNPFDKQVEKELFYNPKTRQS